jgi:DNA-binding IclR family transcriptional regulator
MGNGAPQGHRDGGDAHAVSPVRSVDRAVTILEILARRGEAGVTEIAARLGVHKSTAFRLVAALEKRDLVVQEGERGKYRLGPGLVRLAGAARSRGPG